jgi:hypothetical protein
MQKNESHTSTWMETDPLDAINEDGAVATYRSTSPIPKTKKYPNGHSCEFAGFLNPSNVVWC